MRIKYCSMKACWVKHFVRTTQSDSVTVGYWDFNTKDSFEDYSASKSSKVIMLHDFHNVINL